MRLHSILESIARAFTQRSFARGIHLRDVFAGRSRSVYHACARPGGGRHGSFFRLSTMSCPIARGVGCCGRDPRTTGQALTPLAAVGSENWLGARWISRAPVLGILQQGRLRTSDSDHNQKIRLLAAGRAQGLAESPDRHQTMLCRELWSLAPVLQSSRLHLRSCAMGPGHHLAARPSAISHRLLCRVVAQPFCPRPYSVWSNGDPAELGFSLWRSCEDGHPLPPMWPPSDRPGSGSGHQLYGCAGASDDRRQTTAARPVPLSALDPPRGRPAPASAWLQQLLLCGAQMPLENRLAVSGALRQAEGDPF